MKQILTRCISDRDYFPLFRRIIQVLDLFINFQSRFPNTQFAVFISKIEHLRFVDDGFILSSVSDALSNLWAYKLLNCQENFLYLKCGILPIVMNRKPQPEFERLTSS